MLHPNENADVVRAIEAKLAFDQMTHDGGANQGLAAVADVPAQDQCGRKSERELNGEMRRQRSEQHQPPRPGRGEQQRRQHNRIWRPQGGDGTGFEG